MVMVSSHQKIIIYFHTRIFRIFFPSWNFIEIGPVNSSLQTFKIFLINRVSSLTILFQTVCFTHRSNITEIVPLNFITLSFKVKTISKRHIFSVSVIVFCHSYQSYCRTLLRIVFRTPRGLYTLSSLSDFKRQLHTVSTAYRNFL